MNYYEVAIINRNLEKLSYHSKEDIKAFTKVLVPLKSQGLVNAAVINKCDKPSFNTKEINCINNEILFDEQKKLCEFISKYYAANISLCLKDFVFASSYEKQEFIYESKELPELSTKQENALKHCKQNQFSLIFGDTGSGKTEIYTHLIDECLKENKQVLFLMPEISLTPQMQKRMQKYFNFITWHSKITKTNKQKSLKQLLSGEVKLVLGARSALFLPFTNLGLIIVDEEHDNSYKSSTYPCYNAKDLALYLAKISKAKIVLGSATPSLNSYINQNIAKVRLKGSFKESKKEFVYDNSNTLLSPLLLSNLKENLEKKEQSIIFLPVRGNFRQVLCKDCGQKKLCPNCSIAMSVHNDIYKCHYCNHKEKIKQNCEYCNSTMLESKIQGTAQIMSELQKIFSNAAIAKLDSDELSSASKLKQLLNDFNDNKIDILIGTQMVSKGHDYANVTFCAILGLDEYLFYPDFKARENTLALAIQVSGRAGRSKESKVLIQTKQEEFFKNYLNDYDLFLEDEAAFRMKYPPFTRMLRIIIEDKDENSANLLCQAIAKNLLDSKKDDDYELLGYGKCAIEKIKNKYRYQLLISSRHKMLLSSLALNYKMLQNVTIDIDPIHFS
ncbi:primosomal protein N' [Campylobacter canadensis]|uniref:Replication restart protein PriA n=1 Tax=Campylobacter canadensis TaxID=449520 RepID=A0ABS7WQZ9_9BACT|nr:primosomal protein N' [Campylobacter canadensis]MBZ7987196.1 primosomal protein N' [Campylobacter canadensis]MBZ7998180.1 primosomal protein N' [Campylobacter canadensis]